MERNFHDEVRQAIKCVAAKGDEAKKLSVEELEKEVLGKIRYILVPDNKVLPKTAAKTGPAGCETTEVEPIEVDTEEFRRWAMRNYFMVLLRDKLKPGWENPHTPFEAHLCCDQTKIE